MTFEWESLTDSVKIRVDAYCIRERLLVVYYLRLIRMLKIKRTDDTKQRWGCGTTGNLKHC
jgi:hypothetical protein